MLLLCTELNIFQSRLGAHSLTLLILCEARSGIPGKRRLREGALSKIAMSVRWHWVLLSLIPVTFTFCLNFDCVG